MDVQEILSYGAAAAAFYYLFQMFFRTQRLERTVRQWDQGFVERFIPTKIWWNPVYTDMTIEEINEMTLLDQIQNNLAIRTYFEEEEQYQSRSARPKRELNIHSIVQ